MARPANPRPSYLRHKASGQARVRIDGQDVYLGKYNLLRWSDDFRFLSCWP